MEKYFITCSTVQGYKCELERMNYYYILRFRREYFDIVLLQGMLLELDLTPLHSAGGGSIPDWGKQSVSSVFAGKKQMKKCKVSTRAKKSAHAWEQATVSELAEHKMKLVLLEIKNAKLAEEKLKLEVLVHKARLEYYCKRNANYKVTDRKD
jgi:hypothetical protein